MFSKTSKKTETHRNTQYSKHEYTWGYKVSNLPKLIDFSFKELPLPEHYDSPLEGYSSTVINKSYCTKLYLPKYIFLIHFEFDCGDEQSDALPQVTDGQRITETEINKKVKTKQFLHPTKVEYQSARRISTESILELDNLPLEEYLKTYGKGLKNVDEFLALYEPAEKKFQQDLPLDQEPERNSTMGM